MDVPVSLMLFSIATVEKRNQHKIEAHRGEIWHGSTCTSRRNSAWMCMHTGGKFGADVPIICDKK